MEIALYAMNAFSSDFLIYGQSEELLPLLEQVNTLLSQPEIPSLLLCRAL